MPFLLLVSTRGFVREAISSMAFVDGCSFFVCLGFWKSAHQLWLLLSCRELITLIFISDYEI